MFQHGNILSLSSLHWTLLFQNLVTCFSISSCTHFQSSYCRVEVQISCMNLFTHRQAHNLYQQQAEPVKQYKVNCDATSVSFFYPHFDPYFHDCLITDILVAKRHIGVSCS